MSEIATPVQPKYPEGVKYSPIAFAIVSLVGLFFLYQFVGGGITLLLVGGDITTDNVTVARIATMVAQFIFLLVPTLILAKMQHGFVTNALRWRVPSTVEIVLSILGMIALLQAAEGYIYFQERIPLPEDVIPFVDMVKKMIEETYRVLIESHSVPELILVIAVVSLTPAICEEIFFRGLVQKNISLGTNGVRGVIITGIIFGLYHFNPFHAVPLVALGIYFSFLQFRSQSLIIPMIAHFTNNTLSVMAAYVYGFNQSDMPSILIEKGETVSAYTVLGTTAVFIVIFVVIVRLYIRATEKLMVKNT
ncbi:MAG: CPBP family intramembrane metalloprotease [Ignavibacteriales bacterium]|nr:CPBP family intramembrane metalloprotease [Ignavibacteriales bacterium]